MKVEFGGRTWDLDTAHVSFRHALGVQEQTGLSIADWEDSLAFERDDEEKILNPPAQWLVSVGALYWLMLAQNGEVADPETMDFDWTAFLQAYYEALMREARARNPEPEPEPGPTFPSGGAPSAAPATRTAASPFPPRAAEGAATGS